MCLTHAKNIRLYLHVLQMGSDFGQAYEFLSLCLYLVPFWDTCILNIGVTLKSGLRIVQGNCWLPVSFLLHVKYPLSYRIVIENGTSRKLWCDFILAFHTNHGRTFSRLDTIHERDGTQPATTRQQRSRLCIASRGKNAGDEHSRQQNRNQCDDTGEHHSGLLCHYHMASMIARKMSCTEVVGIAAIKCHAECNQDRYMYCYSIPYIPFINTHKAAVIIK